MMYKDARQQEIPCLSFMKETDHILYVGPDLDVRDLAKLHALQERYSIIYLPEIVGAVTEEVLRYNFPGVALPAGLSAELLYGRIRSEINASSIHSDSRVVIRYDGSTAVIFDAGGSFDLAVSYIVNKCSSNLGDLLLEKFHPFSDFECRSERDDDSDIRFSVVNDECLPDSSVGILTDSCIEIRKECLQPPTPEECFDHAMARAAEEARAAIRSLLLNGFSAEVIRSWLVEDVRLSRLRVTRQYKILLVDYDMEVKMGPLPKTVFLFYLRHPEGVRFTYLQDHVKELRHIYGHVCRNDDPRKMEASIASLTDPFNNSINEKCAAVKKAFLLQVDDTVAVNYYIKGMQGGSKGISLDRSLVEWECEL